MNNLEDEIRAIVTDMENQESKEQQTSPDEVQDIYVFVVREHEIEEDQSNVVESEPVQVTTQLQKTSFLPAYAICVFYLFLIFSCIAFQFFCIFNPPTVTVTIIPKTQRVTLSGTLQLGRLLPPLTISQSQTTATTGKGHQDARVATGTVTFYNGQQSGQTVALGTVFTGRIGVSIETTQQATIPPGNPTTGYGSVTVTAQAVEAGSNGNIQAGDVNTPIALAVFVKSNQFTGGQDERDFSTVSQQDINKISTPLKTTVAQSMQAALQGQLTPSEQRQVWPCTPTVASDHSVGQEATTVKVTVSQTCSAVAYNRAELVNKATALLTRQALQKMGTGYSLMGSVQVSVTHASVTHTATPLVFLSFQSSGSWVYALSQKTQLHIKQLIGGKTKQKAAQILQSQPGIEHAAIRFECFGDAITVPKNSADIHITLFVL